MHVLLLCSFLVPLLGAHAAPAADLIDNLPGLQKQPDFKQYSGYLNVANGKHLHYWFVESQNDPSTDPVVLWLNGGPGCSSMVGLLTENGPFLIWDDGATLKYNSYSWNKITNVLYVESPVGVGFSYSDDHIYATNDTEVSMVNYLALKEFFRLFPEFSKNELYLTGESYAGIYIPTLAERVMEDDSFNLKGIALGNPLSSYEMNDNSLVYFAYYHGLLGTQLWHDLQTYCCSDGKCDFHNRSNLNCSQSLSQVNDIAAHSGVNLYNIYAPCAGGVHPSLSINQEDVVVKDFGNFFIKHHFSQLFFQKLKSLPSMHRSVRLEAPCTTDEPSRQYLNNPLVKHALHISDKALKFEMCSNEVGSFYGRIYMDVKDEYLKLLSTGKYRILVYVGDTDMACNFLGNEWFVESLQQEVEAERRPWLYQDGDQQQVGGFVKRFKNLDFLTVKGSGHMVPTDKPVTSYTMFTKFIKNQPY
ncbi:lysosomal protective protein-like [Pholidichthys leucotaenia]